MDVNITQISKMVIRVKFNIWRGVGASGELPLRQGRIINHCLQKKDCEKLYTHIENGIIPVM